MKPSEKALIKAKRAEKRSREKQPALSRVHLKTRIKYIACMAGYILLPIALWLTPTSIFTPYFIPIIHILRWATIAIAAVASFFLVHVIIHPEWAVKKEAVKREQLIKS
jgi:hypothetical protein